MNEKSQKFLIINTAVFFTLLFWIAVGFIVFKFKLILYPMTGKKLIICVIVNELLIIFSPLLTNLFEKILSITQKIGAAIFTIITCVVYFFILTPIAVFKRIAKSTIIKDSIDKNCSSYYQDWEPSTDIEKQF